MCRAGYRVRALSAEFKALATRLNVSGTFRSGEEPPSSERSIKRQPNVDDAVNRPVNRANSVNEQVVRFSYGGVIKDKKPIYVHPVPDPFTTSTELDDDEAKKKPGKVLHQKANS
jgi:hypothetical protein